MKYTKILALSLVLFATGCSHVTSTVNSSPNLSGELWYVRTNSFMGLVLDSYIYYCPSMAGGAATCTEAKIEMDGEIGHKLASVETRAPSPVKAEAKTDATTDTKTDAKADAETKAPEATTKPEPQSRASSDPLEALWEAASAASEGSDTCEGIATLLQSDSDCKGEQCRPALALATVYKAKCEDKTGATAPSMKKLRPKWGKQIEGQPGSCYSMLLRTLNSTEDAHAYPGQCLTERKAGKVEEMMLAASGKEKKRR